MTLQCSFQKEMLATINSILVTIADPEIVLDDGRATADGPRWSDRRQLRSEILRGRAQT